MVVSFEIILAKKYLGNKFFLSSEVHPLKNKFMRQSFIHAKFLPPRLAALLSFEASFTKMKRF